MRKNSHDWQYIKPNGSLSKVYKTYMGCFRQASKLYPFDTDRMIYMDGKRAAHILG